MKTSKYAISGESTFHMAEQHVPDVEAVFRAPVREELTDENILPFLNQHLKQLPESAGYPPRFLAEKFRLIQHTNSDGLTPFLLLPNGKMRIVFQNGVFVDGGSL
jgi:hypothetical protein